MTGRIELHFDGDIAPNHRITLRTLGTALEHVQSALDRAFLDVKYGHVWKHARLRREDYAETDFILGVPREGGFIIDMVSRKGGGIVRRLREAISGAIAASEGQGEDEFTRLKAQVATQQTRIIHGDLDMPRFVEYQRGPQMKGLLRAYGDRSIAKEIDQLLSVIRHRAAGDSVLEIDLTADNRSAVYKFDRAKSQAFHRAVSRRELAEPTVFSGFLRSLDKGNQSSGMRGKFLNADTDREVNLFIAKEEDFDELHPHLRGRRQIEIVASPVIEYGAYDDKGGDIYFLGMADKLRDAVASMRKRK